MSVTVHVGSGAVKLDALLLRKQTPGTSRIPFSETRAARASAMPA
jgi:hypothetical protein